MINSDKITLKSYPNTSVANNLTALINSTVKAGCMDGKLKQMQSFKATG